jgi:hypothetical protein
LPENSTGTNHDRLDAFMAAWVASMDRMQRRAHGIETDPNDAAWVPIDYRLADPRTPA